MVVQTTFDWRSLLACDNANIVKCDSLKTCGVVTSDLDSRNAGENLNKPTFARIVPLLNRAPRILFPCMWQRWCLCSMAPYGAHGHHLTCAPRQCGATSFVVPHGAHVVY